MLGPGSTAQAGGSGWRSGAELCPVLRGSEPSCRALGAIHRANRRRESAESEVNYLLSVWRAKPMMLHRRLTKPQTQSCWGSSQNGERSRVKEPERRSVQRQTPAVTPAAWICVDAAVLNLRYSLYFSPNNFENNSNCFSDQSLAFGLPLLYKLTIFMILSSDSSNIPLHTRCWNDWSYTATSLTTEEIVNKQFFVMTTAF